MGIQINVPQAELVKRRLFLAVPMYGGNCNGMFARSCMDLAALCKHYGISLQVYFLFNESLVTRARNYCVDEFMRSDSTHLMFIDSDIGFNPQDVLALMALQSDESEYDIIAGPYPKKTIAWEKIKMAVDKGFADDNPSNLENFVGDYVFNPKAGTGSIPIGEPVEVLEAGTGFMMIRRKTFDTFAKAFPQYSYRPDHVRTANFDGSREIIQYFQAEIEGVDYRSIYLELADKLKASQDPVLISDAITVANKKAEEVKSKRYLSEDYWFCQKVQELNMKTWLCPWMKLQHVGSYIFGGSLADLAALGASATADASQLKHIKK